MAKALELKARMTVYDMNWPAVRPTVWAVDAYERLPGVSSVRAQPSTAMSCVAHMSTRKYHQPAKPQTGGPPGLPVAAIMSSTTEPRYSMPTPDSTWMGRIQLLRRPTRGLQHASTMGLQRSLSE